MTKIDKNWTKLKKWTKIENWTKIGQNWKFDKNWKIGQKLKIGQKIGICTNVNCFQFFYFQFSTVKKSCRISDLQVIGVARGKMVFFFFFSLFNWKYVLVKRHTEKRPRGPRTTHTTHCCKEAEFIFRTESFLWVVFRFTEKRPTALTKNDHWIKKKPLHIMLHLE